MQVTIKTLIVSYKLHVKLNKKNNISDIFHCHFCEYEPILILTKNKNRLK